MAEDDGGEGGEGKLPRLDHGPLNERAVEKIRENHKSLINGNFGTHKLPCFDNFRIQKLPNCGIFWIQK